MVNRLFDLNAVPDDYPLSDIQQRVVIAAKAWEPQINLAAIQDFLSEMVFPLYFFDYETFSSAVPFLDRTSPHKHFPVQYSLHILGADEVNFINCIKFSLLRLSPSGHLCGHGCIKNLVRLLT